MATSNAAPSATPANEPTKPTTDTNAAAPLTQQPASAAAGTEAAAAAAAATAAAPTDATAAGKKKKNKKKKPAAAAAAAAAGGATAATSGGGGASAATTTTTTAGTTGGGELALPPGMNAASLGELMQMRRAAAMRQAAKAQAASHDFWKTQPVPEKRTSDSKHGPLEASVPRDQVRQTAYELDAQLVWCETDIDDDATLSEVYKLLNLNYVEDDDNMFRFDYSKDFLRWALKPPGWRRDWHIGIRAAQGGKLLAFITAVPAQIHVFQSGDVPMVEINFLCVHKRLRTHGMAPLLIKEITRRVHLTGVFQAVYTAGVELPAPMAVCRYWHRSLQPKKLIDVGFSHLGPRMTMARTIKLYRLPDAPQTPGVREFAAADVPAVHALLETYLKQFAMAPHLSQDEVAHWLLPRAGVIDAFVVEDPASHKITDFFSFYTLPSTIIGNQNYKTLKAAYSYYNVPAKTPIVQLMQDALIMAKQRELDVFNCLDIMQNEAFLKELKFGIGDGNLHYYLYNWDCPDTKPSGVGLVLL